MCGYVWVCVEGQGYVCERCGYVWVWVCMEVRIGAWGCVGVYVWKCGYVWVCVHVIA